MKPLLIAQGTDYVHKGQASIHHSVLCMLFKVAGVKKYKENKGPDNLFTREKPIAKLNRRHICREETINENSIYYFLPKKNPLGLYILYLHGGAYTAKFMKQHWKFISRLISKNSVSVVAPDYPLAPQFTWEDNISFMLSCYIELLKKTSSDSIIFMGDSAGGGLALALSMAARDAGLPQPRQIIMLSPWLDLQMKNPTIKKLEKRDPMLNFKSIEKSALEYAGNSNSLMKPYVSPIFGDLKGLSGLSIFIGGRDVLKADTELFKAKCQLSDIDIDYYYYPKMMHVWMLAHFLPESKVAFKQISNLIGKPQKSPSNEKR